jgi:hypothetical protein
MTEIIAAGDIKALHEFIDCLATADERFVTRTRLAVALRSGDRKAIRRIARDVLVGHPSADAIERVTALRRSTSSSPAMAASSTPRESRPPSESTDSTHADAGGAIPGGRP